ncbi:unnamed protein product [Somion occarium]|uniref:J domain-containing protein n=1 Tax=Somion occarium TaxID=3059160 RepID=A0ABP1DN19_9APHY
MGVAPSSIPLADEEDRFTSGNYYTILGVAETATPDEVKVAYRRLALQYHPDRNHGDEQKATDRFAML